MRKCELRKIWPDVKKMFLAQRTNMCVGIAQLVVNPEWEEKSLALTQQQRNVWGELVKLQKEINANRRQVLQWRVMRMKSNSKSTNSKSIKSKPQKGNQKKLQMGTQSAGWKELVP